jgi:hypothetical protein
MAGPKDYPDTSGELVRRRIADGSGYDIMARRRGFFRNGRVCIGSTLRTANRGWKAVDNSGRVLGEFRTQHEAAGALYKAR